jgi:hypothetical protein
VNAADDKQPSQQQSRLRTTVERASLPALTRLSTLPRAVPFVVMLALIVAGLWVQGVAGFVLILLGVLFLGWLLYLGWPRLGPSERLMRFTVILLGSALAVIQLFPK